MWLQRKIMSRIKRNPKFFDFDAIQGRKALSDTVAEIAPENTCLVLDIGDGDPDDSYSRVSYEKVCLSSKQWLCKDKMHISRIGTLQIILLSI